MRPTGMAARGLPVFGALAIAVIACGHSTAPDLAGSIDLATAATYFREFDGLCGDDAGRLWGLPLCGPILLVDPESRAAVGNRPDAAGILTLRSGVHVGQLPPDVSIANTATKWSGVRWTMLIWWSLDEDRSRRLRLMAHEAFHRIQPELGLDPVGEMNAHLDTAEGRFWMQMEWNALQTALLEEGARRREAVGDALAFRAARHVEFPLAQQREIPLEIFEGLAEYSGMRLAGYAREDVVEAVTAKRDSDTGFVRSFAYVSGPLYGYLLDGSGVEWRARINRETDLGAVLADALSAPPGQADLSARREEVYGGPALRQAELERDRERTARRQGWRASLIDGPVLAVDLNAVTSGSFDPGKVYPFGNDRTVYESRELIAEWGRLEVRDGVILEDWNTGMAYVSLEGADDRLVSGNGWTIEVAEGWRIVPADRKDSFEVRKD